MTGGLELWFFTISECQTNETNKISAGSSDGCGRRTRQLRWNRRLMSWQPLASTRVAVLIKICTIKRLFLIPFNLTELKFWTFWKAISNLNPAYYQRIRCQLEAIFMILWPRVNTWGNNWELHSTHLFKMDWISIRKWNKIRKTLLLIFFCVILYFNIKLNITFIPNITNL